MMNQAQGSSTNMMDMLKAQLMTMTMMSSMNNGGAKSQDNGIFNVIYVFIATGIIDFLCKTAFPAAQTYIIKYYKEQSNNLVSKIADSAALKALKTKSASITVLVNVSDHENVFGQALLDFATNNDQTKHISFKNQNFVLNQTEVIEIAEDVFIKLQESKMLDSVEKSGKQGIEQNIEMFSYTKTAKELRGFLNKITHEYKIKIENKLGDKTYYFNQHPMNAAKDPSGKKDYSKLPNNSVFTMKVFQTNRKFSNLFGPEIAVVRKRVEFFVRNRKWYDAKGIPYTLGLLLSGQAGAGKTSTIKCLANETKRHVININLNNDITKTQLENLFFNEMIMVLNVSTGQTEKYYIPLDQRIYVLEDIDCQSELVYERAGPKEPEQEQSVDLPVSVKTNPDKPDTYNNTPSFVQSEKIDLSFLLNLLDGVLELPGRIVIMTSNYPEKLDHALIRPGRIDIIAKFQKCNHATMIEMMEFFYDIVLSDADKARIRGITEYSVSPAELGKIMFENFGNPFDAIIKMEQEYLKPIREYSEALTYEDKSTKVNPRNLLAYADANTELRPDLEASLCSEVVKNAGHEVVGVQGFAGEIPSAALQKSRKSNPDLEASLCLEASSRSEEPLCLEAPTCSEEVPDLEEPTRESHSSTVDVQESYRKILENIVSNEPTSSIQRKPHYASSAERIQEVARNTRKTLGEPDMLRIPNGDLLTKKEQTGFDIQPYAGRWSQSWASAT